MAIARGAVGILSGRPFVNWGMEPRGAAGGILVIEPDGDTSLTGGPAEDALPNGCDELLGPVGADGGISCFAMNEGEASKD